MNTKTIINTEAYLKKGFTVATNKHLLDYELIYRFLSEQSYWAKQIDPAIVMKSIENSLCFGVYHHQQQVGFARVITDSATFAYIADVFITPEYRKQGLSKLLVQTILEYPELAGLRRWMLATKDAHGLYSQFGFEGIKKPETFMEITRPYTRIV
jgi:GNAT superfamily N-acetyltransferase